MKKRGQGTFEYVLLLAGVLLIVVVVIVLLMTGPKGGAERDIEWNTCKASLALNPNCYTATDEWNEVGSAPNNTVPSCVKFINKYTPAPATCSASVEQGAYNETGVCCGPNPNP